MKDSHKCVKFDVIAGVWALGVWMDVGIPRYQNDRMIE